MQFLLDLANSAFDSACRSIGTTRFGFVVSALLFPLVYLFVRFMRRRWCALKREWIADIVDAVLAAIVLAVGFVGWHFVWVVPHEIYRVAASTHAVAPNSPSVPDFSLQLPSPELSKMRESLTTLQDMNKPWLLTAQEEQAFIRKLSGLRDHKGAWINYYQTIDSISMGKQLISILRKAGWSVQIRDDSRYLPASLRGIECNIPKTGKLASDLLGV